MHRLGVLSKVVQSRESSGAVTLKWSFSSVFPKHGQQSTYSRSIQPTHLICLAKCSLRVKLSWQGGKSVQKNRCPFFFFDGLCESPSTLSLSEPSSSFSSSSPSPISTSSDSRGVCVMKCELSLFDASLRGLSTTLLALGASSGSGRCPSTPPKVCLVGVFADDSSSFVAAGCGSGMGCGSEGRGVVGVCTILVWSPSRARRLELTAGKDAIWIATTALQG